MLSKLFMAFLFLVVAGQFCVRAEENPEDKKLLEALRSDDFDARESAKKKLIERGEAVRPAIITELEKKDLDSDYKDQLKFIVSRLKESDIIKAFDNPKRIDLDLKDEPISTALDKIKAQFGFAVTAFGDAGKKKITLAVKGATFMEAVDAVRKAGNLAYDRNEMMQFAFRRRRGAGAAQEAAGVMVLRESGDETIVPAAAKGPVIVFFENIHNTFSRSINFGNGGRRAAINQKTFNVSGNVLVEPDLRFSGISVSNCRASGAKNEAFTMPYAYLNSYFGGTEQNKGGVLTYNFSTSSSAQQDLPEKLDWKMDIKIQVPVKISEKRFDNLADITGKTQEFMGGTFTLNKIEHQGLQGWKIAYTTTGALMEMGSRNHGGRQSGDTVTPGNPEFAAGLLILDAQGAAINSGGYSGSGMNNTYRVEMDVNSEPKSFVFRKPGESQTRTFEIELPAVPMP